jgi:hypothetical protein
MAEQEKNETNPFVKIERSKMHASKGLCEALCDGPACESDGFTRSFAGGQLIAPTVMLVRRGGNAWRRAIRFAILGDDGR